MNLRLHSAHLYLIHFVRLQLTFIFIIFIYFLDVYLTPIDSHSMAIDSAYGSLNRKSKNLEFDKRCIVCDTIPVKYIYVQHILLERNKKFKQFLVPFLFLSIFSLSSSFFLLQSISFFAYK